VNAPDKSAVRLHAEDGKTYDGRNYDVRSIKLLFPPSTAPGEALTAFAGPLFRLREEDGRLYGQTSLGDVTAIRFLD
jgi:hypothetical protein